MIRKLLFTAAVAYVGKKIMDSQKRHSGGSGNNSRFMNKAGITRTDTGANTSRSNAGSSDVLGHQPTDLMSDHHPGPEDRAPEAFRPDPTAPLSAEDREAMRPATTPVNFRSE